MTAGRPPRKTDLAAPWLRGFLALGPRSVNDIWKYAPASRRTMINVKKEQGVQSRYDNGTWVWYLPTAPGQTVTTPAAAPMDRYDTLAAEVAASLGMTLIDTPTAAPILDDMSDEAMALRMAQYQTEPDDQPYLTKDMIRDARWMHHHRFEDDKTIMRELQANLRLAPLSPKYPKEYLWAVILHVVEGRPLPALPAGIVEPK